MKLILLLLQKKKLSYLISALMPVSKSVAFTCSTIVPIKRLREINWTWKRFFYYTEINKTKRAYKDCSKKSTYWQILLNCYHIFGSCKLWCMVVNVSNGNIDVAKHRMKAIWCLNAKEDVFRMNVIHIDDTIFRDGQLPGTLIDLKVLCYCLVTDYSGKICKRGCLDLILMVGDIQWLQNCAM